MEGERVMPPVKKKSPSLFKAHSPLSLRIVIHFLFSQIAAQYQYQRALSLLSTLRFSSFRFSAGSVYSKFLPAYQFS